MAPSDRSGPALSERVLAKSRSFSFFQLVKLLLLARPGASPPGGAGPASGENIRFRPAASLGFAASDVESVEEVRREDGVPRFDVTVNFMGLYGPSSPMPTHYTEDILWGGDGDGAKDFLDLFNHRLISFVYRAWEKYRYPIQFDPQRRDEVTKRALCLIGLGTPGMEEGAGLSLVQLLGSAGLLAARQRSAAGLEGFLRVQLGELGVRVEACIERWVTIPEAQLMRLGRSGSRLGADACTGTRVHDRSGAFRVVLGPLTVGQFRGLLPRGEEFARLVSLVRLYVADPLDFDVTLRMRPRELPAFRLSASADLPLGQMSWIAPRSDQEGRASLTIRRHDPLTRRRAPSEPEAAPVRRAPPAVAPRVQSRPTTITTTRR